MNIKEFSVPDSVVVDSCRVKASRLLALMRSVENRHMLLRLNAFGPERYPSGR